MPISESVRLRTRLDALTWRLKEASDDLERLRREASQAERELQDARLAALLGEEGAGEVDAISAQSDVTRVRMASEESLVARLQQRQVETSDRYRRALGSEWARRLVARWQQADASPRESTE
ncbi:MAG: hypothetical protein LC772_01545 [Chloroflexi bacterium]|nr:hypothetical protein [Chloroflexota bacterium]